MSEIFDYRKESLASINTKISQFGGAEKHRIAVLNSLLMVAVWHSIKDGQITPACNLLAQTKGDKERVSLYLTKFGNVVLSKEKGLAYSKAKGKVQYGLEAANQVFENLPTLDEAFPQKERQYKDVPFIARLKSLVSQANTLKEHGAKFTFADNKEEELFLMMQKMVAASN